jgi:hypothetical protein
MSNYFNTPNQMVFLNVNQDNGRVIKGSAIMGFSINLKICLDNAAMTYKQWVAHYSTKNVKRLIQC